jgi:Tfp pilus assembly protein FimT
MSKQSEYIETARAQTGRLELNASINLAKAEALGEAVRVMMDTIERLHPDNR